MLFATGIVALGGSCGPSDVPQDGSAVKTYTGIGVVERITPSRQFVQINHDDIPGFMDAMSMNFAVADTSLLTGVGVADSVVFDVRVALDGVAIIWVDELQQ
jgi:Cu/Ag efflux protein CusF